MGQNVIFSNDCLNMRIQQKIKVESLLKWLNIIIYPSKHGDRHQNHFDTRHSDWDIDERRIFRNGGLNLHIGVLPEDDRVASFRFLKSTASSYGNCKKNFVRTILHAYRSLPPDYIDTISNLGLGLETCLTTRFVRRRLGLVLEGLQPADIFWWRWQNDCSLLLFYLTTKKFGRFLNVLGQGWPTRRSRSTGRSPSVSWSIAPDLDW